MKHNHLHGRKRRPAPNNRDAMRVMRMAQPAETLSRDLYARILSMKEFPGDLKRDIRAYLARPVRQPYSGKF